MHMMIIGTGRCVSIGASKVTKIIGICAPSLVNIPKIRNHLSPSFFSLEQISQVSKCIGSNQRKNTKNMVADLGHSWSRQKLCELCIN